MPHPYSHRSRLEKAKSCTRPVHPRETMLHCMYVPCWPSWPGHEVGHLSQKKMKPMGRSRWPRASPSRVARTTAEASLGLTTKFKRTRLSSKPLTNLPNPGGPARWFLTEQIKVQVQSPQTTEGRGPPVGICALRCSLEKWSGPE
jgi:hypothetical protein